MRHLSFTAPLICLALAAPAQETAPSPQTREGLSLIERGTKQLLRGMMDDLDPLIDQFGTLAQEYGPEMQQFLTEMGPKLAGLLEQLDDLRHYQAPEILPNGDIIMRRKPDAPLYVPRQPDVDI